MKISAHKKSSRWLSLLLTAVFPLYVAGCAGGSSAKTVTVHFSAYSPSGHLRTSVKTAKSESFYITRNGDAALNFDTVVHQGERLQIVVSGPPKTSLSAYASVDGEVRARKETQSSTTDSAKMELKFKAD